MNKGLIIVVLSLFFVGAMFIFLFDKGITGSSIEGIEWHYTQAVCDSLNRCVDLVVYCKDEGVIDLEIVGEIKNFSEIEGWIDAREGLEVRGLCDMEYRNN